MERVGFLGIIVSFSFRLKKAIMPFEAQQPIVSYLQITVLLSSVTSHDLVLLIKIFTPGPTLAGSLT